MGVHRKVNFLRSVDTPVRQYFLYRAESHNNWYTDPEAYFLMTNGLCSWRNATVAGARSYGDPVVTQPHMHMLSLEAVR